MTDRVLTDLVIAASEPADDRLRAMFDQYFEFIWCSLRGLGVPPDSTDDAAQLVFMIASQKLDAIASGNERSFLFGTAIGVAANARRARARIREVAHPEAVERHVDGSPTPEDLVAQKEERALLYRVLDAMPEELRTVFLLFVLEGMTMAEVGDLLDLPLGTVASRLRRARQTFHKVAKRVQNGAVSRGEPQ